MSRLLKFTVAALLVFSFIGVMNYKGHSSSDSSSVSAKWTRPPKPPESCQDDPDSKKCDKDKKKAKEEKEKKEAQARREAREVGCQATGGTGKMSCTLTGGAVGRACGDGEKSVKAACGGSDCGSVVTGSGVCTNAREICVPGGPGEEECSCTPTVCKPVENADKFRTQPQAQGVRLTCATSTSCTAGSEACAPTYVNAVPICSILPNLIQMDRESTPKQFELSVTDTDYGDDIEVVSVKVVDEIGKLNTCVKVTNLGGGSLIGTTVRSGTNDPSKITQFTSFLVDPREAHGVFGNKNGLSKCEGTLQIMIVDKDGDGPTGPDKPSAPVNCNVRVEVENKAPILTDIKLLDRDARELSRDSGNLINGTSVVNVGSTISSATKMRASFCKESLTLVDPVLCPQGGEEFFGKIHNPLQLEFTVKDDNGSDDLMQAGVWLQYQQSGVNSDLASVPLTGAYGNIRTSFQALYSEKESLDIDGISYLVSRGCLTSICGPTDIRTSNKQKFSALTFINTLTTPFAGDISTVGNILNGKQQSAPTNDWHQSGFPDCLASGAVAGCTGVNVPATAMNQASSNVTLRSNYAWAISADENSLLCYPPNAGTPTVITAGTPVVCPANCAACIKKEGIAQTSKLNERVFKFGLYFNDRDGEAGMPEGAYSLFISALDKVGVPLNNVTGKGDEGWTRFDKDGNVCTGAACASGTNFVLNFDPIPPKVTFDKWTPTGTDKVVATARITDNAGGSGVSGVSNRYMSRQSFLGGEPLADREWAQKLDDTEFNGANDVDYSFAGGALNLEGKGLIADETIVAGACAFDNAGNMGCGRNADNYTFLSAWLKTSFGDIFSSTGTSAPFNQTIPTNTKVNDIDNTDNTRVKDSVNSPYTAIVAPFNEQIFTAGTGLLITSNTQDSGISGGYVASASSTVSLPFGFKSNYRDGKSSQKYNLFGVTQYNAGNEYERLRALASSNCGLMNNTTSGSCQTVGSLSSMGQAAFNIINVGNATVDGFKCKGINAVFVNGAFTIKGDVTKEDTKSGCLFILSGNSVFTIEDVPSYQRTTTADGKGVPHTDRFDGAIIANSGATITIDKAKVDPLVKPSSKSVDRLEITGWVYSASSAPKFLRNLAAVDNRRYPSEWIVYDSNLLDLFRDLLGSEKTVDLTCGTSTHVLCKSPTN